jgi:hypothetical protein
MPPVLTNVNGTLLTWAVRMCIFLWLITSIRAAAECKVVS